MIRTIGVALICLLFALPSLRASADDAKKKLTGEEQLRSAIYRGDLADVKQIATTIDLKRVPNLHLDALGSPNADVVVFLRDNRGFNITDVQIAAIRGDVMVIDHLLGKLDNKARAEVLEDGYIPPMFSYSPLSLATRNGHGDVVRKLVAFGANVNEATHYTLTPLANAAERGHVDIIKLLLEAGANVNSGPDGYTALMRACIGGRPKAARMLIAAGADPNLKRHDGQRALHFAAKRGNLECVALLLKHGAEVNAVAYGKDTALTYAELYKHKDVVKVLRHKQAK